METEAGFVGASKLGIEGVPGVGGKSAPLSDESLITLVHADVLRLLEHGGIEALPRYDFEHNGWNLRFFPIPKAPKYRGRPGVRAIGATEYEPIWGDSREQILSSLRGKAQRYGDVPAPYVMAINIMCGVRIESMIAMLASVAGHQCIAPILESGRSEETMEQLGLTVVKGKDDRFYFFGDPPNRLLVESPDSLLSLAFGAAQSLGAPVTMGMIHDEMGKVASRVGGPEFDLLDLPPQHVVDRPTEWARVFTPKILPPLDLYDVPPMRRATAIGYALYQAVLASKDNIGPMLAAQIALQCATRTSKLYMGSRRAA